VNSQAKIKGEKPEIRINLTLLFCSVKIWDISLSRTEPFGTRDTASEFGTAPKNPGRLATLAAIPRCRLTPPLQGTPANIRINLILPETRVIGLHLLCWKCGSVLIQIFVVDSERRTCFETQCVMAVQGHPRLLILAPIESAYATSYCSSTVTLVLYVAAFQRILLVFCWEKRPHPYSTLNFGGVSRGLCCWCYHVAAPRSEDPKLIIRVKSKVLPEPQGPIGRRWSPFP